MSEYVQTTSDNGGVHVNSTIVSHAAYLMAKKLPLATVEKIWYRALTRYLHSSADFARRGRRHASRRRAISAAAPRAAVQDAWVDGRRDRVRCAVLDDEAELRRLGYAQQLRRGMGAFGNFALSFSIISILTGAVSLYGYGLRLGGPIEMTRGLADRQRDDAARGAQPGGARLGLPDGGRALSLGVDPRRARASAGGRRGST